MITFTDESVISPAREKDWQQAGVAAPATDGAEVGTGGAASKDRAANALAIDQGLPRLLYELAVRLPAQPDIQALCVWLYQPVRQATRLHVLMGDLPVKLRNGTGFPLEDSIARWVWQKQQPLMINTKAEPRFPEFEQEETERTEFSFSVSSGWAANAISDLHFAANCVRCQQDSLLFPTRQQGGPPKIPAASFGLFHMKSRITKWRR
jgi:hypothetical protein